MRPLRSARSAMDKAGSCLDNINSIISCCNRDPDGWADEDVHMMAKKIRRDLQALLNTLQNKAREERQSKVRGDTTNKKKGQ
jgi:hypothetical protein